MSKYKEVDFARALTANKRYSEFQGQAEAPVRSKAGTVRVDILTATHAYECKFGSTCWKTAIGQALGYAMLSDRRPGIVVFIRTNPRYHEKDLRGYDLLMDIIREFRLAIDVERIYVNREDGSVSKRNTLEWAEDEAEEPQEEQPTSFFSRIFS